MAYIDFLREEYENISKKKDGCYCFSCDSIPEKMIETGMTMEKVSSFHLDLLPQQVIGNISNGKIFICSLNPGLSKEDYYCEDDNLSKKEKYPNYREAILSQLSQKDNAQFFLGEQDEITGGAKWWRTKFRKFVLDVKKAYADNKIKVSDDEIYEMLSRLVVALELFPYHFSRSGNITKKIIEDCESVQKMKDFVHDELIPNARKNNQIVIFTRSHKLWEVTEEEKAQTDVVFCNPAPMKFAFGTNREMGKMIFEHLRKLTDGFTKLL